MSDSIQLIIRGEIYLPQQEDEIPLVEILEPGPPHKVDLQIRALDQIVVLVDDARRLEVDDAGLALLQGVFGDLLKAQAIVRDLAASEDTAGTVDDAGYQPVACHFCDAEPQLIAEGDFYMDMELGRHERGCVYRRACELVNNGADE